MTAIAVREGYMAVESMVSAGGLTHGTAKKWRKVPQELGGGFIAACGGMAEADAAMSAFIRQESLPQVEGIQMIWMDIDGKVRVWECGQWSKFDADYYAAGSAESFMMGAMAAGASAHEAVSLACRDFHDCGAPLYLLSIHDYEDIKEFE